MNGHMTLFFDIETEANPEAMPYIPEPQAPSNYKDAEKIAEYVAAKKAEQVSGMALDADYGRIIAISMKPGLTQEVETVLVGDEKAKTEKDLIELFWKRFENMNGSTCGYNIIGFDLPYLLRRSFDLGINVPYPPQLAKYRNEPTTDLMGILYNWGPAKGLKFVAKRYAIYNPLPELDGSMVANMDRETLRKYAGNDVDLTVGLFKKMYGVYF